MAVFVEQYGVLRWIAVIGFGLAAALVVARLGQRLLGVNDGPVVSDGIVVSDGAVVADRESDAAHLVMCLVMLGMLVFPAAADPHAVRGVLTAMVVVFTLVLGERMMRWRSGIAAVDRDAGRVGAFVYHVVAAAAMWYAMSGHGMSDQAMSMPGQAGPARAPMLALALAFVVDAAVMAIPGLRHRLPRVFPHPMGPGGSLAVVPHVVMDLGTAYMLVAAVAA
ncbi:DUF5134 domain-containing protein [Nocardia yunnanensis]|uniref:DUF5134 domain-containing protein n=1 Tax=Nocardia yunnanensis TaxID=2382165 RepID=UPI0013C4E3FC|nr:DUF5134 domain-containing protein [Nocardia yunnanensis]